VLQRYENAYDLHKHRMKLKQQENRNKVDSHYYKVPDQHSASSSHRCRTIAQHVANSIAKLSELLVSSNNFSDRLPISATTLSTGNASVSSNCMNACCSDNNNNFVRNVRASTPLAADRRTFVEVDADKDIEVNERIIIMRRQQLNNQRPTNKTWLNRLVNVEKHYTNYIPPHGSCEKVSNVQRKQMSQEDRNNIIITEHYYVKNTVQKKPKLKCMICNEGMHEMH